MAEKFKEYGKLDLTEVNREVLDNWNKKDVFHRSIEEKEGHPSFIFYEGPPSANGMPGIHHVLARTIKDIICRYKTMKGFQVNRKAGWDTHGLPVELGVEKTLGITKEDIGKKITVEEYNATCRRDVMKFTKEWTKLTHEMGYWVDTEHPYVTYENKYIETLWWLLKQLFDKGLLYKGYTIQPYSPAAGTGLSSHELNQPGCYRDVKDTTVTSQFKLTGEDIPASVPDVLKKAIAEGTAYALAWTTTPWTLTSNTALCVGPKIKYSIVSSENPYNKVPAVYVLASDLVSAHFGDGQKLPAYTLLGECTGADLVGLRYEQLIPFFKVDGDAFRVIPGDYVTTEDGTGIVHIAPTFGADDARVAKAASIPPLQLVDKAGALRPTVDLRGRYYLLEELDDEFVKNNVDVEAYKPFEGRFVKNAYDDTLTDKDESLDLSICVMLKQQGLAFKIEKHVHNYPHCWRTDKPVLYYPLDSWFIRSTACKDRMIELNKTINWKPASTGTGRFGKWLENLNDWNLSRSRFWGTPLPIWRSESGEEICIGSVEELIAEIEKSVKAGFMKENPYKNFKVGDFSEENYSVKNIDLHRPYIDNVILVSPTGKPMKRETDLIDVWFDSGAMPYAQIHYPFENKEALDSGKIFPADFINEGVDQTRGWFFTLHAIASMLFDSVAFKNVISNGLVLDKNGIKMSKRLGNVINPFECIGTYGADAVRWYMITNSSPWDNLSFDPEGVKEVTSSFFIKLQQAYSFFAMYANVDGFEYREADIAYKDRPDFDRWLLSELNTLVKSVQTYLDDFDPTPAGRLIQRFVIDFLSNWYIRLNKARFWAGDMTADKLSAYQTLYTCLDTLSRLIAPIAPFYADQLFRDLNEATGKDTSTSVHLAQFPTCHEDYIDSELNEAMQAAMDVTSMGLSIRKKVKIPVIQALQAIAIPDTDPQLSARIERMASIITKEVNVKELQLMDGAMLVKNVKCNFRVMGKKFGKMMKAVADAVSNMTQVQISELETNGQVTLNASDEEAVVELADVDIMSQDIPGWSVANEGTMTVALDITVTPELKVEGNARKLIKQIQNLRKSQGFEITDRITVQISETPEVQAVLNNFKQNIASQVLANSIDINDNDGELFDFDDFKAKIKVIKA
jgi:isoleucyl-tRNA synthetase